MSSNKAYRPERIPSVNGLFRCTAISAGKSLQGLFSSTPSFSFPLVWQLVASCLLVLSTLSISTNGMALPVTAEGFVPSNLQVDLQSQFGNKCKSVLLPKPILSHRSFYLPATSLRCFIGPAVASSACHCRHLPLFGSLKERRQMRRLAVFDPPISSSTLVERKNVKEDFLAGRVQLETTGNSVSPKRFKAAKDYLRLEGFDHIEIYCGNSKQAAHWYCSVFGFQPIAYAGLETGCKDRASYVVAQQNITIVLTSPIVSEGYIANHVKLHGDGVRSISFLVPDASHAHDEAIRRGAKSFLAPTELADSNGVVIMSGIHTYGDTLHLFIDRSNYRGPFLPGFVKWDGLGGRKFEDVGLLHVDHIVGNVGKGDMNKWCKYYEDVFGMATLISFDDKDICTKYSALASKVMVSGTGHIKFPINEPADGLNKSQIEEFLDFYESPGVQHIAVSTTNIIKTVTTLRNRGCEFIRVPVAYYDTVNERCGKITEDVEVLKELGVLVDRDPDGYLLQIFTKPVGNRPTVFFEIIQRRGAESFGKGNFRALFESVEAEQRRRGTLG